MTVTEEIKAKIDIVNYIQRFVHLKKAGKNWKACCPFHDDKTPSFIVSPQKQTWHCYGACSEGGDVFNFAMKHHGWTFKEALSELARETYTDVPAYQAPTQKKEQPSLSYYPTQDTESLSERWQRRAKAYLEYCEEAMWADDSTGRDYLMERGFTERTIINNRLGYAYKDMWDDWGIHDNDGSMKKVWLPRGIIIPYSFGEYALITRIRTRRLDWVKGDKYPKYISPRGVQNVAHMTRKIQPGDIVVLTEGEFDGMILKQEIPNPHLVHMATGGTGSARLLEYIAMLSLAEIVFVAFDNDKAGNEVSQYWMDALNNAVRKVPTHKDINDMKLAGVNLQQWLLED